MVFILAVNGFKYLVNNIGGKSIGFSFPIPQVMRLAFSRVVETSPDSVFLLHHAAGGL